MATASLESRCQDKADFYEQALRKKMGGSHRNKEFRSIIRCFLFFDTHDVQKLFRGALQESFSNRTAHMAVFCRLDSLTYDGGCLVRKRRPIHADSESECAGPRPHVMGIICPCSLTPPPHLQIGITIHRFLVHKIKVLVSLRLKQCCRSPLLAGW